MGPSYDRDGNFMSNPFFKHALPDACEMTGQRRNIPRELPMMRIAKTTSRLLMLIFERFLYHFLLLPDLESFLHISIEQSLPVLREIANRPSFFAVFLQSFVFALRGR
eukprot:UN24911